MEPPEEDDGNDDIEPFCDLSRGSTLDAHIAFQQKYMSNFDDLKFIALGSGRDWSCNIKGRVSSGGPPSLKRAINTARNRHKEVLVSSFPSGSNVPL